MPKQETQDVVISTDIEIGAVEIKDALSEGRTAVTSAPDGTMGVVIIPKSFLVSGDNQIGMVTMRSGVVRIASGDSHIGEVAVGSGVVRIASGQAEMGYLASGDMHIGEVTVRSGEFVITSGVVRIASGDSHIGEVTVRSGEVVITSGIIRIASGDSHIGEVSMQSGVIRIASGQAEIGYIGSGDMRIGQVNIGSGTIQIASGDNKIGQITVQSGRSAIFDPLGIPIIAGGKESTVVSGTLDGFTIPSGQGAVVVKLVDRNSVLVSGEITIGSGNHHMGEVTIGSGTVQIASGDNRIGQVNIGSGIIRIASGDSHIGEVAVGSGVIFTIVDEGVITENTASGAINLGDVTKVGMWQDNIFQGFNVKILTGNSSGAIRRINSIVNGIIQTQASSWWPGGLTAGDRYQIFEGNVKRVHLISGDNHIGEITVNSGTVQIASGNNFIGAVSIGSGIVTLASGAIIGDVVIDSGDNHIGEITVGSGVIRIASGDSHIGEVAVGSGVIRIASGDSHIGEITVGSGLVRLASGDGYVGRVAIASGPVGATVTLMTLTTQGSNTTGTAQVIQGFKEGIIFATITAVTGSNAALAPIIEHSPDNTNWFFAGQVIDEDTQDNLTETTPNALKGTIQSASLNSPASGMFSYFLNSPLSENIRVRTIVSGVFTAGQGFTGTIWGNFKHI